MDSLTGAIVAAVAAWLSIVAAILLPVPEAWFQRLRWVGAACIGVVGLTLVGLPLPPTTPAVVLVAGVAVTFLWPQPRVGPEERAAMAKAAGEPVQPERAEADAPDST